MTNNEFRQAVERGRTAYRRQAWADAYRELSHADEIASLDAHDLELLANAAYLTGRPDGFLAGLERAYRAHADGNDPVGGARCAFWSALTLLLRGESGRATGWLARTRRLLENRDCVEQGYLLLPAVEQQLAEGTPGVAHDTAAEAAAIGERFGDTGLTACARHLQGRARIQAGEVEAGLALLDEAMVTVIEGGLPPIITGMVYCSVIEACHQVHGVSRAREWTAALAAWCDGQPQLVAFTSTCRVRRAEILQLHGEWLDALAEARRACAGERPPAAAYYQQGEVHRLRGEFAAAEAAYRQASRGGAEPQPGMALLRLAQGRATDADAAIRRVLRATSDPLQRATLLPAHIEIALDFGDVESAQDASRELEETAQRYRIPVLGALAAHARGAVAIARQDASAALAALRHARDVWQELEVPYRAARVRVLMGGACRALGDHDGATLEWDAARAAFEELGAAPDLVGLEALARGTSRKSTHGLTPRELQVLRLVAAGKTNRAVAGDLSISEKTVARHLSNIFTKLGLGSRAAATAYAYEHRLL